MARCCWRDLRWVGDLWFAALRCKRHQGHTVRVGHQIHGPHQTRADDDSNGRPYLYQYAQKGKDHMFITLMQSLAFAFFDPSSSWRICVIAVFGRFQRVYSAQPVVPGIIQENTWKRAQEKDALLKPVAAYGGRSFKRQTAVAFDADHQFSTLFRLLVIRDFVGIKRRPLWILEERLHADLWKYQAWQRTDFVAVVRHGRLSKRGGKSPKGIIIAGSRLKKSQSPLRLTQLGNSFPT